MYDRVPQRTNIQPSIYCRYSVAVRRIMLKLDQIVVLLLSCMLFAAVDCAQGDDSGLVVKKTAVIGLGSRDVILSADTYPIVSAMEYS